jgi:hypothetical protein
MFDRARLKTRGGLASLRWAKRSAQRIATHNEPEYRLRWWRLGKRSAMVTITPRSALRQPFPRATCLHPQNLE